MFMSYCGLSGECIFDELLKIKNNLMRTNELALQQTLNKFLVTTIYEAKEKDRENHHVFSFHQSHSFVEYYVENM